MMSKNDKLNNCLSMVILFYIVGNPVVYKFVDRLLSPLRLDVSDAHGCPTQLGVVVHALVFALLLSVNLVGSVLFGARGDLYAKSGCVLLAAILFFVVSNTETYKFVNRLVRALRLRVSDGNGCPTQVGVLVHGVVFCVLYCVLCVACGLFR